MAWNRDEERKAGKAMTMGSCIFGLVFAIFWCIMATAMGAGFMLLFGIPFACLMAYRLVICARMVKAEKEPQQEADPWNRPAAPTVHQDGGMKRDGFCPYCGSTIQAGFEYCPKCGRKQ